MIISVFNCSNGRIADDELQAVIRAVNTQIARDFEPYWSFGATLRLEGHTRQKGPQAKPFSPLDMRGDAVLYVWDHVSKDYDGVHDRDLRGVPYGIVCLDASAELGEEWSATLSHEALELMADPQSNLLVQGPHPTDRERDVFHWFEMCDAVQSQVYKIDNVTVSDFVLPLYFTPGHEAGSRNNFLGAVGHHRPLQSFGVTTGGYIGYFDPRKNDCDTYELPDDDIAAKRKATKARYKFGRRVWRSTRAQLRRVKG